MASSEILAGAHTVDVTPPEGVHAGCWGLHTALAEGVHDRLELAALVLVAGGAPVALVGIDASHLDASVVGEARSRIARLTGIGPEAVLINASHDHAAPRPQPPLERSSLDGDALEQYNLGLAARIAGAVYAAVRRLEPARIAFGRARAAGVSVNRVDRSLPVDDAVWVMRVDTAAGAPLGLAVSAACHPITVAGQTRLWDSDYPGPLRARLRAELGLDHCVFLQGAAGDVAPFDFWFGNPEPRPHSFECRDDLARGLAEAALEAAAGADPEPGLRLAACSRTLDLPRRRFPWSEAELAARAEVQPYTPESEYPELWDSTLHTATSAQRFPDFYQHHSLALYRRLLEERGLPLRAEIQAIRLGDHALSASPFEPFTALAGAIVADSPFADTRVLGYSNGYAGYLPPPGDYATIEGVGLEELLDQDRFRWAYGITTAFVGAEASAAVIAASLEALEQLRPS